MLPCCRNLNLLWWIFREFLMSGTADNLRCFDLDKYWFKNSLWTFEPVRGELNSICQSKIGFACSKQQKLTFLMKILWFPISWVAFDSCKVAAWNIEYWHHRATWCLLTVSRRLIPGGVAMRSYSGKWDTVTHNQRNQNQTNTFLKISDKWNIDNLTTFTTKYNKYLGIWLSNVYFLQTLVEGCLLLQMFECCFHSKNFGLFQFAVFSFKCEENWLKFSW